jgi:hypothetical protein
MHEITHVVQPVFVGWILRYRIRAFDVVTAMVRIHPEGQIISPGIVEALGTTTSGLFPFCLCGEADGQFKLLTQPFTVGDGVVPGDGNDGLLSVDEARVVPTVRWRVPRRV